MSEFPVFRSGEEFLRYMEQLVVDIRAGRVEDPPYHAIFFSCRAEAEESLQHYRNEAARLGFAPERVVMLRDPASDRVSGTESSAWVVLIPRDQDDATFDELWGTGWDNSLPF
ncbi:hypothetical protein [Thermostichus sp. OS-CIW-29]|jgi:hypothetical protein